MTTYGAYPDPGGYGIVQSSASGGATSVATMTTNPNPFAYAQMATSGYDAPFNPQLDSLYDRQRTQEWRPTAAWIPCSNAPISSVPRPNPTWHTPIAPAPASHGMQHGFVAFPISIPNKPPNGHHVHTHGFTIAATATLTNPATTAASCSSIRPMPSNSCEKRLRHKPKMEVGPLRPFSCPTCGKAFSQAANLTAHRRVHTGEKPFLCPVCQRPFSQSSSLVTHKRTHSGERPYNCAHCEKSFTDSSTLTKHLRTHTGQKPYACPMCLMRFTQSGNLHRHMKTHKGGGSS